MASHKMTYMMPTLVTALVEMNLPMIKFHLKEPNGAISQAYLQSCIEWAVANSNIPLLKLLFTMLVSDPEPMVALQTWPKEAFQELMNFIDKNQHLLKYTAGYVTTLNEYMCRFFVNYKNLRIFFKSEFGKQFLHKMPVPVEDRNKEFLTYMGAKCMQDLAAARAADAAAAAAAASPEDDPSSREDVPHPATTACSSCLNPTCYKCK